MVSTFGKGKNFARHQPSADWEKTFAVNVETGGFLDQFFKVALIGGGIFFLAYVLVPSIRASVSYWWCTMTSKTPETCDQTSTECPDGYHSVDRCAKLTGLPKFLCQLAAVGSGGMLDCEPDVPPDDGYCQVGAAETCVLQNGTWTDYPSCECDLSKPNICTNILEQWQCALKSVFGSVWDKSTCSCVDPQPSETCTVGVRECVNGFYRECATKFDYATGKLINTWMNTSAPCNVDPVTPCSKFNGNNGQPYTCPEGNEVCDKRSCGTPDDKIYTCGCLDRNGVVQPLVLDGAAMVHYGRYPNPCEVACNDRWIATEGNFGAYTAADGLPCVRKCADGAWVDACNVPVGYQGDICAHDAVIDERAHCVHNLLGARPGQGAVVGSPQIIDVYVNSYGWFRVPGYEEEAALSPLSYNAWIQCGGFF